MDTVTVKGSRELLTMTARVSDGKADYTVVLEDDFRVCCRTTLDVTIKEGTAEKHAFTDNPKIAFGATLTAEETHLPQIRLASIMNAISYPHNCPSEEGEDVELPVSGDLARKLMFEARRMVNS